MRALGDLLAALWRLLRGLGLWVRRNLYWRRVKALWRIGRSAVHRYWRDDGDALAGYVAYSAFLAMFPFAIFATALAGTLVTTGDIDRAVDALFDLAPSHIAQTLEPVVRSVALDNGRALVTTSALLAMWVASNAVEALRVAFDRAYRPERERGFALRRARALAFVVLASLTFLLLGLLIVFAPVGLQIAERMLGFSTPFGLGLLRYGIGLAAFALFLFQMHLFLPSRRPPRRRLWPGVWVTVALWTLGAWAFTTYLGYAPSYSITYGAFAGVIVTLLFFYLTGAAIILGAEVNAVLMAFRHPTRADSL